MTSTAFLLDGTEAAKSLRMMPARLKRMARRGLVPVVRLPDGELRFDPNDLRKWIESHKQPAMDVGGASDDR